jgi:two-component system phosphate regulon sensor histidine kinase PhoR
MDDGHGTDGHARWRTASRRLADARWVLLAAAVALVAVSLSHRWPALMAALGLVLVCGAAALAPRRRPDGEGEAGSDSGRRAALDRMTAADLAAVVPDPLIVFDRAGAVVLANKPALDAFGPLGAGVSVQLKFRAPEMQALIARALEDGAQEAIEYSERVPIERVYGVAALPVGEATGLLALAFRDQSEARRIDRMRADFIANASHELRTPLASISGFIETLRGPARNDAKARHHFLEIMESQTARMARLIDDLLSLSRIEMKPHQRPADTVDIVDVCASVIDALSPLAAELGLTIERQFPDVPAPVVGNRDELFQLFENLVENACKYGQSGERVIVSITRDGTGTEVTVRDFGPGIQKQHIPRITERFYRVDVETSRARKGTGLGLSIVKHIVNRHEARLSIRSEVGQGAAFSVHFPVR